MTIQVGDTIPEATLMRMGADGPEGFSAQEAFAGKTVALFALPGAFTPTCSAKHLPGFIEKSGELKTRGVDEIACVSVNDVFVMDAWGKDQNAGADIAMWADGNGEFAEKLGLTMDGTGFGMGKRAQRFSMLVQDGVVKQLNVEAPGEYRVSSADHLLSQL